VRRHLRVARSIAADPAIPRWLRALLVFGALPIPGPVDDVALVVGVIILVIRHRATVAEHYALDALGALVPLDTWGAWG
jgi:hypothetical protein